MSLKEKIKIIPRQLMKDDRGWFLKAITGKEEGLPAMTGEVYLTMGKPGESKGGHYHPKAMEWFTLVKGNVMLKLVDMNTLEKMQIMLKFEDAVTVFVPNNVGHIFVNDSNEDFILLAYTDLLYNPVDTIAINI